MANDPAGTTVYDDFATAGNWPGDKWYRHRLPGVDLWDPATVVTCGGAPHGTLRVELERFTVTRRDSHDNVKALIYSTAEFRPGERGLVAVGAGMRVTTSGTQSNPYGADPGDVRLGCGALNTIDLKSWMVFDFFVSGSAIVALYERLPFGQSAADPYPAFTELVPIAARSAPGEWHRYEIRYDRGNDRAEWRVDGEIVAERRHVGAPPGERAPIVKLDSIRIGGGLFTLLGDLNNDRRRAGDGVKIAGLDPRYEHTPFGQGACVEFGRFEVTSL